MGDLKIPSPCQSHSPCSVACYLTKAVQLLCSLANLLQCLFKRVGFGAVLAQNRLDYPLEEGSSCSVGVENADRRYRHGKRSVVFDLYTVRNNPADFNWPHTSSPSLSCDLCC
jgi:hypothetical protein